MNESYIRGLATLKRSFGGRSETPAMIEIAAAANRGKPLTLLDVGTGDGEGLVKITNGLRKRGLSVHATGIDKYTPVKDFLHPIPEVVRLHADFDSWLSKDKFDIVTARQSLYYLRGFASALQHLRDRVSSSGMLMIVVWTEDCFLNQVSRLLFGNSEATGITVRRVVSALADNMGVAPQVSIFRGPTDVHTWLEPPNQLSGVLEVLSRSEMPQIDAQLLSEARRVLSTFPSISERQNGIVWARL